MNDWHEEFRAYARAFGRDEVAAVLLRDGDREWLIWPSQDVEGLTFELTANAILDTVPPEHMGCVVGWVHSHPLGMDPTPSGTDHEQVRTLARDLGGGTCEMWIFGGHAYRHVSLTRAHLFDGAVFVSDTKRMPTQQLVTPWDEAAAAFYEASKPAPRAQRRIGSLHSSWREPIVSPSRSEWLAGKWDDAETASTEPMVDEAGYLISPYSCSGCGIDDAPTPGALCEDCEDMVEAHIERGAWTA